MKSLLTRDSNITAVITIIDRVIPGVLQAVQAAGRSIPADFSLVGVFSSRIAEMLTPPLTGISSSVDPGKIAIETLVRRLEGEEREPVQVLIPPELVVRLSTGPRQLVLV